MRHLENPPIARERVWLVWCHPYRCSFFMETRGLPIMKACTECTKDTNVHSLLPYYDFTPTKPTPMEVKSGMKPATGAVSSRYAAISGGKVGGGGSEEENAKPVPAFGLSQSPEIKEITPTVEQIKLLIGGAAFRGRKETFV